MTGHFRMLNDGQVSSWNVTIDANGFRAEPSEEDAEKLFIPGFVDIHIHGALGIDFMTASKAQMRMLAEKLEACGYEAFYPTTVSASAEAVLRAVDNLPDDTRMPGFHLEGPFISPRFPGAQPKEAIIPIQSDDPMWDEVFSHPKLRVITLAPELDGACELARRLSERGVRVSMGHTNATHAEALDGMVNGFRHVTHTFNAMRAFHHREPGIIGCAFNQDELICELIYDRLHVSPQAALVLVRNKPRTGVIAVSDGTMASGMTYDEPFAMWDHEVEMRGKGVYLAGTETLAGSGITLLDAFRNFAKDFGPAQAIQMCCLNPRTAMGFGDATRLWIELSPEFEVLAIHHA